jgi:membrane dipeptidase
VPQTQAEFASRFAGSVRRALAVAVLAAASLARAEPDVGGRAAALHSEAIVVDGHNDVTSWILDYGFDLGMDGGDPDKRDARLQWVLGWALPTPSGDELRTHTDLARLRAGGVDALFFSIFAHTSYTAEPGASRRRALAMIDALDEQLRRHADALELARTTADVRRIAASGKLAALMGLEGGHAIENDLAHLREFAERGVRYMTLTWTNTNDWADSSTDAPRHGGLSDFGREVVREMNRLGILVDVSHVSDETFWDTVLVARAPLIASHSSARALVDRPRNMSDDMLRAVARSGGVVMVSFTGLFVDPRKASNWEIARDAVLNLGPSEVPLELVLDHVEHVARVAGVDHVGLGSDFDGAPFMPVGLEDVAGFPNLTAGLLARGWAEEDVRKVLGENILRAFSEAEAFAEAAREGRRDDLANSREKP